MCYFQDFPESGCKGSTFPANGITISPENALTPAFLLIYDWFCGRKQPFIILSLGYVSNVVLDELGYRCRSFRKDLPMKTVEGRDRSSGK